MIQHDNWKPYAVSPEALYDHITNKENDTVKGMKGQNSDWEQIFANQTSDKGLASRIYKELSNSINKKPNNPTDTLGKYLNIQLTKKKNELLMHFTTWMYSKIIVIHRRIIVIHKESRQKCLPIL